MKTAVVDFRLCQQTCRHCAAAQACQKKAIKKLDLDEPAFINQQLCHGCGDCLAGCPFSAIKIMEI